jgi:TonB family protein
MNQRIARWLVQHAARNAPPSLSERLEEEWLADLATRHGRMAQLRFGVGCCWATRVIAHEFGGIAAPVAAAATAQKVMTAYAPQHDSAFFSRRSAILLLIVGLHGFFFYALKTGLAHSIVNVIPAPFQAVVLPADKIPDEPPPPLAQPDFSRPTFDDSQPDIPPLEEYSELTTALELPPRSNDPLPPAPSQQRVVNRVMGGPGKGFPATDDFYPSAARRLGETGLAIARVCVDERGRVTELPTIAQTSGSARLDEGALKLAKAGSGHYRPSTEDGRPVSSCYPVRIRFQLTD